MFLTYIIPLILLLVYSEMLGKAVLNKFHNDGMVLSFPVGVITIFATAYLTTGALSAMNVSFYILLIIYGLLFLYSIYFIYRNLHGKYHISYSSWLVLLVCVGVMFYYNYHTTLGELNGFDSTHYINMVTGNIANPVLNSSSVVFGDNDFSLSVQYTFQSYFYVASCFLYLFEKIYHLFDIEFFAMVGYVWIFQLLYDFLLASLIINALNKLLPKRYLAQIFVTIFLILGFYKVYFNSAFGFYGNMYRTVLIGYALYFAFDLFQEYNFGNKILLSLSLLSACSVSSTGVFIIFFMMFSMFFILIDREDNLFKWYAVLLFVPAINLLTILFFSIPIAILVSIVVCAILYVLNDILIQFIRKFKLKYPLLILSFLIMFFLSYTVTHDIFNFDAFFQNISERYDMTLDYFDWGIGYSITNFYKKMCLFLLMFTLIFKPKEKITQIFYILILVFFNPFVCSFLFKVNVVYHRAYDLIINPYTVVLMFYYFIEFSTRKYKGIYYAEIFALSLLLLQYRGEFIKPLYWHNDFVPGDNYNYLYKMNNDEINVIKNIKAEVEYNRIEEPKIITPNLLTEGMIPTGIYIYGREYQINPRWSESERNLYDIFWPVLHYGDKRQPENPDYNHMCEYIKDADIDFIVQPKSTEYYDEERKIWYSLTHKIDECGTYAFYENDSYSVYFYND